MISFEEIKVYVKKLSPVPGDVIIVRWPQDAPVNAVNQLKNFLVDCLPEGITIVTCMGDIKIEKLDRVSMLKAGWVRVSELN